MGLYIYAHYTGVLNCLTLSIFNVNHTLRTNHQISRGVGEANQFLERAKAPSCPPWNKPILEELVEQNILALVTQPIEWISYMEIVPKKDGKLRNLPWAKDLNEAIKNEYYPLPTIEEIATWLHGAKVFTVLDVCQGFLACSLGRKSSLLTTFNTQFGRYKWKQMPFGITSAPEVFQYHMHKVIEGLLELM